MGIILAVAVLVDLGVSGGDNQNTVVTKIVTALLPESPQGHQEGKTIPNIPAPTPPNKKLPPFSITSDLALLRGEGFFYIEDGILYRNKLEGDIVTEQAQKIAEGAQRILAQNEKLALFNVKSENSHSLWDNELWVIDKESGTVRKIYEDVVSAQISPEGNMLAVFQYGTEELHLINENGNLLNKIGTHAGYGVFSGDGNQVAYHKLADVSQDGDRTSLLENAYGIAVYNLKTGTEFLATHQPGDFYPVEFSPDGKVLYFISDRGGHALWSVDLQNGEESQLSKPGVPVYINHDNAIWFSNKLSAISETDGKISLVHILPDQKSIAVQDLGEGTSPRWKVQDRIIEFNGKDGWTTVDIASSLKK